MGGAEHLQVCKLWHLMQFEDPRAVGCEEDPASSMKVHSSDLGTPQLKVLPAAQPPLPSCVLQCQITLDLNSMNSQRDYMSYPRL